MLPNVLHRLIRRLSPRKATAQANDRNRGFFALYAALPQSSIARMAESGPRSDGANP